MNIINVRGLALTVLYCNCFRSLLRLYTTSVRTEVTVRVRSQTGITPRLVNPLGEKTFIRLAGITETAAHIQEACSRSRPW